MTTTIDTTAPVIATASVHVDATAEQVWDLISSIDGWPQWNPDVSASAIDGPLAAGTTFTWKAGPGTIRSTLLTVDAPHLIAWTGKTMGITAVHVWRITPGETGVDLTTEESWRGLLPSVARSMMRRSLDKALRTGLEAAKAAVEAR